MGQKPEDGRTEPSLELPSLLGRRKKTTTAAPPTPPASPPAAARRRRATPTLPGPVAAAVTGAVVGAVACGLTYLALVGCEAVRGTSTCGGPGLFLLIAILAAMVMLGAGVLTALRVADAAGTSFLAVALVAVLVMVAFLDVVFSGWMFLVVPALAAACYALAQWVTGRFADDGVRD